MLASLLVSVLLVGIKLAAAKELMQINERRKELKTNLALLQIKLEDEHELAWIADVAHDAKERELRISEIELASNLMYSLIEKRAIETAEAMFAVFEASSTLPRRLKHASTVARWI